MTQSHGTLSLRNPASGEVHGHMAMATPAEVECAFHEMRQAFQVWQSRPVAERVRVLRQFQQQLLDSLDEITAVLTRDCGKSRQDALIEVFMTVDMLDLYCKHAPEWLRPEHVSRGLYLSKRCVIEHRPYGVVAVIAPWNYPLALALPPTLAALLTGNTVVLKPSEVTASTGALLGSLFGRVPELAPFVRVLLGDGTVGQAMVRANPDYIFLTGSPATGRKVLHEVADRLTPVACELGGKDAMIVLEDADLEAAAHWGVWGACFNAGQTCMAVERVYVVESRYDEFVRLAVEEARKLKVGYTTDTDSPFYFGPITDPRQLTVIQRQLDDAVAQGARVLTGGQIKGMFVDPTVLVDVDSRMLVLREETFGPLMPIVKVKDEAEAIRAANDSDYGLGASVWSRDVRRAERVARQLEAGSVIINDVIAQFAIPTLPFGGVKHSGSGRIHGKAGFMQFTQPHSYVLGTPPLPLDIATVMRKPGHYRTGAVLLHLTRGTTWRRRLRGVWNALTGERGTGDYINTKRAAAAPVIASVLAAAVFAWRKRHGAVTAHERMSERKSSHGSKAG